jgi:biopolymer transport protein ExbB/TolQ
MQETDGLGESKEAVARPGALLNWHKMDIEERLGFKGAKYTDVNNLLSLFVGLLLLGAFYGVLLFLTRDTWLAIMFLDRLSLSIPFWIAFFASWALAILFIKWRKLVLQSKALNMTFQTLSAGDFVLAKATAPRALEEMRSAVFMPEHFVLFSRIDRALGNLQNIGGVADVIDMLKSQADNDEDQMESSYTILRGFVWAIPVLGFIGTVLGLSASIGGFGNVLSGTSDVSALATYLKTVTGGLSTAFETTLQGLVAALAIQLLLVALRKKEERFLDGCREYCHKNLVSKLRLIDLRDGPTAND